MEAVNDHVSIAGWPGASLDPPPSPRYRFRRESDGLSAARVAGELVSYPPDTALRVAELDHADRDGMLAFLNQTGVSLGNQQIWSFAELDEMVSRVRDAVTAWRLLVGEPSLTEEELAATRFGVAADRRSAAAEFLGLTLAVELRAFTPVVWVGPAAESPGALDRHVTAREVPLPALCCLELHNHVVTRTSYARCRNESCGRLFSAGGSSRRTLLYCSPGCRHAQAQREFRRRKAAARDDAAG